MQTHPLHTGFDFLTHIHSSSLLPGCFKESPESNNNHIAIYTKWWGKGASFKPINLDATIKVWYEVERSRLITIGDVTSLVPKLICTLRTRNRFLTKTTKVEYNVTIQLQFKRFSFISHLTVEKEKWSTPPITSALKILNKPINESYAQVQEVPLLFILI